MPGTSEDALDKVIEFIWENQRSDVEGENRNYYSNIADETNLHIDTVRRAINFLEKWKLAKTWKEGARICVRLTWNPEKNTEV